MGVEQVLAEGFAINAVRDPNRGEGGERTFLWNVHGQTLTLKATPEALSITAMTSPGLIQSSSASRRRASRMPKFMFTGAVWWYTRSLPQYWFNRDTSRYQFGTFPLRDVIFPRPWAPS